MSKVWSRSTVPTRHKRGYFFFLDQPPPSFYRSSTGALRSQSSAILYLEEADTSRGPPRHRDQQRRVNWNANLVDQSLLRQPNRQTYVEHSRGNE